VGSQATPRPRFEGVLIRRCGTAWVSVPIYFIKLYLSMGTNGLLPKMNLFKLTNFSIPANDLILLSLTHKSSKLINFFNTSNDLTSLLLKN